MGRRMLDVGSSLKYSHYKGSRTWGQEFNDRYMATRLGPIWIGMIYRLLEPYAIILMWSWHGFVCMNAEWNVIRLYTTSVQMSMLSESTADGSYICDHTGNSKYICYLLNQINTGQHGLKFDFPQWNWNVILMKFLWEVVDNFTLTDILSRCFSVKQIFNHFMHPFWFTFSDIH